MFKVLKNEQIYRDIFYVIIFENQHYKSQAIMHQLF